MPVVRYILFRRKKWRRSPFFYFDENALTRRDFFGVMCDAASFLFEKKRTRALDATAQRPRGSKKEPKKKLQGRRNGVKNERLFVVNDVVGNADGAIRSGVDGVGRMGRRRRDGWVRPRGDVGRVVRRGPSVKFLRRTSSRTQTGGSASAETSRKRSARRRLRRFLEK